MIQAEVITRPHGGRNYRPQKNKQNKYIYADLQKMQAWSLKEKEEYAHSVIERALTETSLQSCAFSAGKDSTVLLHMLLQHKKNIHVIWGNTTIEFPESIQFAKFLAKDWRLNFYEVRPEVSFWWVVNHYGWPLMGKTFGVGGVAHKSSREQFFDDLLQQGKLTGAYKIQAEVPISSACCTFLKERPSVKLQKQIGIDCVFLGILAHESRRRMFNYLEYGNFIMRNRRKFTKLTRLRFGQIRIFGRISGNIMFRMRNCMTWDITMISGNGFLIRETAVCFVVWI